MLPISLTISQWDFVTTHKRQIHNTNIFVVTDGLDQSDTSI